MRLYLLDGLRHFRLHCICRRPCNDVPDRTTRSAYGREIRPNQQIKIRVTNRSCGMFRSKNILCPGFGISFPPASRGSSHPINPNISLVMATNFHQFVWRSLFQRSARVSVFVHNRRKRPRLPMNRVCGLSVRHGFASIVRVDLKLRERAPLEVVQSYGARQIRHRQNQIVSLVSPSSGVGKLLLLLQSTKDAALFDYEFCFDIRRITMMSVELLPHLIHLNH